MTTTQPLSSQEVHLYDRQLRVWGVETQYRIRQARVLLLGPFNGLASEIAKNLTLAGVKYLDICEGPILHLVTPTDLSAHLFLDETCVGKEVTHNEFLSSENLFDNN
jgi:ubiquitin-like 1-activating enzyme E1 A